MPGSGSIRKSDAEGSTCSRTAEGRAGGERQSTTNLAP
jgi:hypothetical protein